MDGIVNLLNMREQDVKLCPRSGSQLTLGSLDDTRGMAEPGASHTAPAQDSIVGCHRAAACLFLSGNAGNEPVARKLGAPSPEPKLGALSSKP